MKKWIEQDDEWNVSDAKAPFPVELCYKYLHFQMHRRTKEGNIPGSGSLGGIIRMLKHEGFTKHGFHVPEALLSFFRDAQNTLKRKIQQRIDDQKQHLPDSHAQNASWQSVEYCAQVLHDWKKDKNVRGRTDPRCHMYFLGSVQSICRGERFGKVPVSSFRLGKSKDHIIINGKGLSSKSDPAGKYGYDKKFWPNFKNVKMCFITALGRALLSGSIESEFVFMTKSEADCYNKKVQEKRDGKKHKKSAIGPHNKFDRTITSVFTKLPEAKRVELGISQDKNWVPHCKKKAGFKQALEADGVDSAFVGTRGDHHASNFSVYGARPIKDVPDSGGPPARHDATMSKILAGLAQYTPEFNADPPHWDPSTIKQVSWADIVPQYAKLPTGMKAVVPLAVAQVVYHYHQMKQGLSKFDGVFKSPLWVTHQALRDDLFNALRGGDTGQPSVLKSIYRDRQTDQYLWTKQTNETTQLLLQEVQDLKKEKKRLLKEVHVLKTGLVETQKRVYALEKGSTHSDEQVSADACDMITSSDGAAASETAQNGGAKSQSRPAAFVHPPPSNEGAKPQSRAAALVLPPPPDAFEIQDGISVEDAWFAWHGYVHSFPWKSITPNSPHLPKTGGKRRKTLQLLSNISILMNFIQGNVSDDDVRQNIQHAWNVCKNSAQAHLSTLGIEEWPFHGSVRTAYGNYTRLRKQHRVSEHNVENFEAPKQIQQRIDSYYQPNGILITADIQVSESRERNGCESDNQEFFDASKGATPPQMCYICPACPEDLGSRRNCVVYRTPKTLWQHWDTRHKGEAKPELWKVHLVSGMKLEDARTAPWVRVEHALSSHSKDYATKNMREEILDGRRELENGTYVELQPTLHERSKGDRWFAVVRDGRVRGGEVTVEYCDTNSQKVRGPVARVHVQSILKVGPRPHIRFSDVPEVAATSAPHTPNKRQGSFSPMIVSQSSPAQLQQVISTSAKKPRPAEQESTAGSDESSIQHQQEISQIESHIKKKTNNSSDAMNAFADANARLVQGNWRRCITKEGTGALAPQTRNSNVRHKEFTVQLIPRDGDCLFHCFVHILAAKSATAKTATVPKNCAELRKQMHEWARDSEEGRKSKHGGFHANDGKWLPLEDSLLTAYGGAQEIMAFTNMYDVTVHVHAPETVAGIQTYQGSTAEAHEYNILQTLGWKEWYKDKNNNFVRSWGGDHWQVIEVNDCRKMASSKGLGGSAAQASTAKTAVKLPLAGPSKKLDFSNCDAGQQKLNDTISAAISAAAEEERQAKHTGSVLGLPPGTASAPPLASTPAPAPAPAAPEKQRQAKQTGSPSFTLCAATEDNYPAYVHFMLREVSATKRFVRNPIPDVYASTIHNNLRIVTLKDMHFLEDCFGETFLQVYPSSVQQLLYAFPVLDETYRSFFMCLGIGANIDPYMLQHTFRSHARRLSKDSVNQNEIQTLGPGKVVNWRVLQWCWPAEFDAFRIHVLDSNEMFVLESPGSHKKHDMILRFERKGYTLLHAIEGATAQRLMQKVRSTKLSLWHETNQKLRCQMMGTFDVFFNTHCFVSAALQGSDPSEDETVSMWKEATAVAGLEYDENTEKWITVPVGAGLATNAEKKTAHLTDGSLHRTSWNCLQQKLLDALESDAAGCEARARTRELRSPPRCTTGAKRINFGDVTFMDAGSEAGKGLYWMMSDKRITHVAGVEIQQPWYDASCLIMAHLRQTFAAKGYRMPAVTIVRSCMVAAIPELTYLYSIASIMWCNNFVFHKVPYFAAKSNNKSAPQPLLKGVLDLTSNAAFRFSQAYSGVTFIALHNPAGFSNEWNYTCFKPFNVRVTWGETACEVTIIRHIQQLHITEEDMGHKTRYALVIPNREELQLWDDNLKKWSQLIPTLYNAISEETFHTDYLARKLAKHNKPSNEGGPIELSDGDEYVQDSSFQDAEAASSASQLTQQMPSARFGETGPVHWPLLLTLTDSNWLPDTIMFAYLNLLKDQFPTIMFLDLRSSVKRKAFRSRKVVVGYKNLKACHWIAAKLDMTQNLATIADSLYATFQDEHDAVFENLQQLANKAGHRQELQRFTVDVPDQRNTNDCGVFACLFQLYMAQSVSVHCAVLIAFSPSRCRI